MWVKKIVILINFLLKYPHIGEIIYSALANIFNENNINKYIFFLLHLMIQNPMIMISN